MKLSTSIFCLAILGMPGLTAADGLNGLRGTFDFDVGDGGLTGADFARRLQEACIVVDGATPWEDGNGHYYKWVDIPSTWSEAKIAAEGLSICGGDVQGHLATFTSAEENDFVWSLFQTDYASLTIGPWLGGFQIDKTAEPDGNWEWVTGEAWDYTNWYASNEPNNGDDPSGIEDCLNIRRPIEDGDDWNDIGCIAALSYVVEFSASTTTFQICGMDTGILDPTYNLCECTSAAAAAMAVCTTPACVQEEGAGAGLSEGDIAVLVGFYNKGDECPTALEEAWRVGPFSVAGQTLSLRYGSIGDAAATKRVIQYYARATPTNAGAGESIELNCFGEIDVAMQEPNTNGIGITETEEDGNTQLAITFNREVGNSIEDFVGYKFDIIAPTVEFCVKVTLGDSIFRQMAVKYTFNLNGAITIANAVVFNDDGTSEVIVTEDVTYGIDAYLCDVDALEKTVNEDIVTGDSIFICLESNDVQASVSSVFDLKLTAGDNVQTVVSRATGEAIVVSNLASGSCAGGKCQYEVILDQVMFEAIEVGASAITISVTGEAEMQLGNLGIRRSLEIGGAPSKEERSLQEAVGDITGEFEVTAASGVGSSAATRLGGGMVITSLVVAIAALWI